jgi:hypothetical protein
MKPTRQKRDRVIVPSPDVGKAHGRLVATAPALRRRVDPGDPAEVLAFALIEHHLQRRGIKGTGSARGIKARMDRARQKLRLDPKGAELVKAIASGLTSNGGALLRTVESASVEARPFAAGAAVRFVALVREHDIQSTAALVLLASASQWSALGELLRDRAFASTETKAQAEALKSAASASQASRLDLLTGLQVERVAQEHRNRPPTFDWSAPPAPAPQDSAGSGSDSVGGMPSTPEEDDAESSASSPDASPSPGRHEGEADGFDDGGGSEGDGEPERVHEAPSDDDDGFHGFNPRPDVAPADPYLDAAARQYRADLQRRGFLAPDPTPKGARR